MVTILQVNQNELEEIVRKAIRDSINEIKSLPDPLDQKPDSIFSDEVFELCGWKRSFGRKQLAIGQGPPGKKFGKRWIFSRREVLAWIEAQKQTVNPDKMALYLSKQASKKI